MIDYELQVFNICAEALERELPGVVLTNRITIGMPSEFPSCCIAESNNAVADEYIDSSGIEQAARVTYGVDIFSNKRVGAKQEAKAIFQVVDHVLYSLNLTRRFVDSYTYEDGTIYRIVASYEGIFDVDGNLYRR